MGVPIRYSIPAYCNHDFQTLVLVVRLLNLHKTESSNDPGVCTACFAIIISFLEGNSTKNKSYVSQMMRHIFTSSVSVGREEREERRKNRKGCRGEGEGGGGARVRGGRELIKSNGAII